MRINDDIESVTDSELFPIFVASGYDIYGLTEPLYFTDGIYINPDGSLEFEDDAEDVVKANHEYEERKNGEEALESVSDEELFSENKTARVLIQNFSEVSKLDALKISNDINLALINLLDTIPQEHLTEKDLLESAIDAGFFAAKRNSSDFAEKANQSLPSESEVLTLLCENTDFAESLVLQSLGYDTEEPLKTSILGVKELFNSYPPQSFSETINVVSVATGLQKRDLAYSSIRLSLGTINYENLVQASMIGYLCA